MATSKVWQKDIIVEEREAIRASLEPLEARPKERLKEIINRIGSTLSNKESKAPMQTYLLIMFGLIHHQRHGGMKQTEVKKFVDLALGTLSHQRVGSPTSTLGFLYADLYHTVAQIYRRDGEPLASNWYQHLAHYFGKRGERENAGLFELSIGIRELRLGNADIAIEQFETAERLGLTARSRSRAIIEKLRALRLSGKTEKARGLLEDRALKTEMLDEEVLEIQWEKLCLEAIETKNVSTLILACRRGLEHNQFHYAAEAFLWSRASSEKKWISEFPALNSFGGSTNPESKRDFLYRTVQTFVDCYESTLPLMRRLETLGETLLEPNRHFSIDKEVLTWACAARWFNRNRNRDLTRFCMTQYQALSRRLSGGTQSDAFGLLEDINE